MGILAFVVLGILVFVALQWRTNPEQVRQAFVWLVNKARLIVISLIG